MITLVIPCYNEAKRLRPEPFVAVLQQGVRLIFVDDGSKDQTFSMLNDFFANIQNVEVIRLQENSGKAEAIRAGVLHALLKKSSVAEEDWIGFWDADLATPFSELGPMLQYQGQFYPKAKAIFGSRVYRLGARIRRSPVRHYLGRGFATLISHALQIEAYDTQCGAKLFKTSVAKKIFGEPFQSSWIFDVELLLRLGQENVVEYPLLQWQDVAGSKVRVLREIPRVLMQIWKIRKAYLRAKT